MGRDRSEKCAWGVKSPGLGVGVRKRAEAGWKMLLRCWYLVADSEMGILERSMLGVGFAGGSVVKNPPTNAWDASSIPGLGRSSGEGNGNYASILAWEILWLEEPGGLQSMGSQRVGHDLETKQKEEHNVGGGEAAWRIISPLNSTSDSRVTEFLGPYLVLAVHPPEVYLARLLASWWCSSCQTHGQRSHVVCESQERTGAADGSGQPSKHRVSQEAEANVWSTRGGEEARWVELTAEILIPHWVSLFSRKGRSWCSTSHLGSDRFGSLSAAGEDSGLRAWRWASQETMCCVLQESEIQAHRVQTAVLTGRKRAPRRRTRGKVDAPGRRQWGGVSLGCTYPFADSDSPLLQALLQAHLQSQGPEWKMDEIANGSLVVWRRKHYELVCEIWPHSWFSL